MKKKNILLSVLALSSVAVTACQKKTAYDSLKYSEADANIYREKNKIDKSISLRFYENMPHVPYIGVKQYYQEFFNTSVNLDIDDTIYTIKSGEASFTFDVKKDTLGIGDIDTFSHHPDFISNNTKVFLAHTGTDVTASHLKMISLADYGINVFGDKKDKDVYVPLTLLSELSGGGYLYNVAYNGKDIYVLDGNGSLSGEERFDTYFGDAYFSEIDNMNVARSTDMAEYAYNQLCLTFDHLRGYTSQLIFGDNNLLTLGLDGVLEQYYPKIKRFLLSTDKKYYYAGLYCLFAGLYDGGHTVLYSGSQGTRSASSLVAQEEDLLPLASEYLTDVIFKVSLRSAHIRDREAALNLEDGETKYYRYDAVTKTAYIGFNSFDVDYQAWDSFYKGNKDESEAPVDTDTYAFVRSKLYQAKDDGVENVILDLTTNGGGNSHALNGLCGLFNGANADFTMNNTVQKTRITEHYKVDINLDGKYDEADVEEANSFDFKVAVLTGNYSFSCANLFPSLMKEYGYSIVGARSGGGSCAISLGSTADGITFIHSNYHCLSNANGDNIDDGVPLDFEIPIYDESGVFDGSHLYDYVTIKDYLDTL